MAPPILVAVLVSIPIPVQRRGIKYQLLEFGNEQGPNLEYCNHYSWVHAYDTVVSESDQ